MYGTHSLDALDPNAYAAFQASHDLKDMVDRVLGAAGGEEGGGRPGMKKSLSIRATLMTPVKPMLVKKLKLLRPQGVLLNSEWVSNIKTG